MSKTKKTIRERLPYVVEVRLSHFSNRADRDGEHRLEINDPRSGARLLELELDSLSAARLLLSNSSAPATLTHARFDAMGMYHHIDTVLVPDDKEHKDEHLALFEVDGWRVHRDDYGNHHRWENVDGKRYYRVGRSRLMDTPQEGREREVKYDARDMILGSALDIATQLFTEMGDTEDTRYRLRTFMAKFAKGIPTNE